MITKLSDLKPYAHEINWNLDPATAVTLYLEWGNNNWHGDHPPVRSASDVALYFVLDCWTTPPCVRLVRRNSERADDIATIALPDDMLQVANHEYGNLNGIYEPHPSIKDWLRKELGQD